MTEANFAGGSIWTGDNLRILRGMNSECVDLIYLDPPFNSNRNYEAPIGSKAAGAAFKDAWTLDDVDVYEHGELADRNPAAHSVIAAARLAHGKGMMSYLIFMAVRLLEMHRVLKPTGSIHLHCDPTASHYLKGLMDAIFGRRNFKNEIIWSYNRFSRRGDAFAKMHDILLFYGKSELTIFNKPTTPARDTTRYEKGYHVVTDDGVSALLVYDAEKAKEKIKEAEEQGREIRYTEAKQPALGSVWADIPIINPAAKERTGYPTQKPLALLERIVQASSNPGDMVLDPFCGCATTLVAAYRLQRRWAGIDLSPLAVELVNKRITDLAELPWEGALAFTDAPHRTDLGKLPNYRTHRHRLYGEQEGVCAGCDTHFPFRVMEVDHILPRAKGGTDHPDNLQLLCSGCNRSKGERSMAEWRAANP